MLTDFKEELMDEDWEEPPMEISFQDVGELSKPGPSRFRKNQLPADTAPGLRLPDVTVSSIEAMNRLLQHWGLEALSERFAEHLIDLNVLDYILDVDIADLCRDFPIRYRLVLRHNLQNGYHKQVIVADQPQKSKIKQGQAVITFSKDPEAANYVKPPDRKPKRKKPSMANDTLDPSQFVQVEENAIRPILEKELKFRPILCELDQGLVPDTMGIRYMNRIVTGHFFEERILEHSDYPTKAEKHALALKILEAYPQLERTRVTPDAPKESYFFWINGGKEKGPHSGLIEYRTTNLRREVPPEKRRYLRMDKKNVNYVLPESIREHATKIASLPPIPANEQTIANGMAECIDLHSCILQQNDSNQTETLVSTFPHLLSYGGKMVQEVFQRLHTYYESSARTDKFLLLGSLLDSSTFRIVENKYIRATLRIMKKLIIIPGKKEEAEEMLTEEAQASPLIRWIQVQEDEMEIHAVQRHVSERSNLPPHILCLADVFREGSLYIVFQGKIIACENSAPHALDVFFKLFAVFGIPVPLQLRKIHELLMVYLWKVTSTCKSVTVSKLMTQFEDMEVFNKTDECAVVDEVDSLS